MDQRGRLRIVLEVVKGINYLHCICPPIFHCDLKSPNSLVDKKWTVKVYDFWFSRFKANTFISLKSVAGKRGADVKAVYLVKQTTLHKSAVRGAIVVADLLL
ncbi:serine/threonine-protein kinase CTR1-like protein [Tanacetum coccineum]